MKTRLGRVNLRVWKELFGIDYNLLWELMQKAQKDTPRTTDLFIQRWEQFRGWINSEEIKYPSGAQKSIYKWLDLINEIASKTRNVSDLPMVSHSPMYKKFYNPSYRIVREIDISI